MKSSREVKKEEIFPNSPYEYSITLIPKIYRDTEEKENYKCKNPKQNISKSNLGICKNGNIS